MTENLTSINEVLHFLQKNLAAPKNQFNSFGKYKYRSCEDILEGLKKVLPQGSFVTVSDEIVEIGGRIYVKATASLTFKTDIVSNTAFAREEESKKGMDAAQLTGATSSYARKYALNGLFLIDDTKDPDTDEAAKAKAEAEKAEKAKPKEQPKKAQPKEPVPMPDSEYNYYRGAVGGAESLDELKQVYTEGFTKAREYGDKPAQEGLTKIKDIRKEELEKLRG